MTQVHAPYHFVPLSKWVYMPDWAHLVSHDMPFKDGYSGVIDYTLTNGTPLCVGGEKDHNGILRFARDGNNNLTIPGSSLKGMIRNVLEIASFGKFSAVDDTRFSYRDFSKISYKNSVHQLIKNLNPAHLDNAYFDMAELILGTLRENSLGLKSRVFFSDAIPTQVHSWDNVLKLAAPTVLSAPKATFLGAYIEQNTAGTYDSYDQDNSKLAGWKRYPTRKAYKTHEPSNDNNAVINQFELLPEGHEFQGKIVFHNLKSEKLAALLWCLTLENRDDHWHGLGHAKPLGAGAVKIRINLTKSKIKTNLDSTFTPIVIEHWIDKFIQHMNEHFAPTGIWGNSPQLAYLMAVTDQDVENFNHFDYLTLDDHKEIKKHKLSLPSLELHGDILNRTENYTENSASLAFAKGRLSVLFDNTSPFHQQQLQAKDQYYARRLQRLEKAQLAAERLAIENTELEPYDKIVQFTQWLIKGQKNFSNTDKNKHTKALRENIKQLKVLSLTAEQAGSLIENFGKIDFCQKDTSKAIAILEKFQ